MQTGTQLTQEEAYQSLLQQAARQHWHAVYEELMRDGFLTGFNYLEQLELWRLDSESLLI